MAGESSLAEYLSLAIQYFNPRPPITTGESKGTERLTIRFQVSIRARQLRRANPLHALEDMAMHVIGG